MTIIEIAIRPRTHSLGKGPRVGRGPKPSGCVGEVKGPYGKEGMISGAGGFLRSCMHVLSFSEPTTILAETPMVTTITQYSNHFR